MRKQAKLQHVALAWNRSNLLCNSAIGELLSMRFTTKQEKPEEKTESVKSKSNKEIDSHSKVIHHEHTRVIYNIHLFGSIVVSYSHDRSLIGYCLKSKKICFNLPTLGSAVNTMNFCIHDSSWITLGLQESSIRLINLHSTPPLRYKTIASVIKGKVFALSWHPKDENKLLFGTGDGQVGVADVGTGRVSTYALYHQKPVYKVEWATSVLPEQFPELEKKICAYSFGDREIIMRDPDSLMADPVKLTKVCKELPDDISEFTFTPDFKYLAVGCLDGVVSIFDANTLVELVTLVVVRKTIQHLLWQPVKGSEDKKYTLAIASSDTRICMVDLDKVLAKQSTKLSEFNLTEGDKKFEAEALTSCTRELNGHGARVVWLSFSPHNTNLLASASYDHTCQVWDTTTGEHLGNYRGHVTRVFRVEFSPNDAGMLFSFGEENSVHQWRMTELKDKSPPGKIVKVKELESNKPSKVSNGGESEVPKDAERGTVEVRSDGKVSQESTTSSKRNGAHKSIFPLLHEVNVYKRHFLLANTLCLNENMRMESSDEKLQNGSDDPEDILKDLEESGPIV